MILPRVKEIKTDDVFLKLPCKIGVKVDSSIEKKLCSLFEIFLPGCEAVVSQQEKHITAIKKKMKDEEYNLEISENGIEIEYFTYRGLRNAVASISVLAKKDGEGFILPYTKANDFPVAAHRGVMIDLARGTKPLDEFVADIILIAKMKMNYLHLHIFDSQGVAVELDSLPVECCIKNYYTKEEMQRVIELADVLALEIIPEFDMPAHSKKLIECFSELGCDTEEKNTGWTICAGEEKAYELYERIINELADMFPGEYLHIGGDEIEFGDIPHLEYLCHWNSCKKCIQKCNEEGIKDRQELYYYFILRIYDIVKKTGKKMIMWSDQLDCSKEIPLPKDILMQFWRVAAKGRGPVEGCSMEAQMDAGYTLINSFYWYVYGDLEEYLNADKIIDWHWANCSKDKSEAENIIIGSEFCAWEYGNKEKYPHYEYTFAPSVVVMADKLWNGDRLDFTDEYQKSVTKAILGCSTPDNLDLFKCFGAVIPPKDGRLAYIDKIGCSKEELYETIELLDGMKCEKRCLVYKKCFEDILEKYNSDLK